VSLYGDIALRTCTDLDILLPEGELPQAFDALVSRGYEPGIPRWFLTRFRNSNTFEYPLRKRDRALVFNVELHEALSWETANSRCALQAFWEAARRGVFWNSPHYEFDREDQFLFLMLHAARHNWQGLKWLADIHLAATHPQLSWIKLASRAEQTGLQAFTKSGLGACQTLFDTPIPSEFSTDLPRADLRYFLQPPGIPGLWQSAVTASRFSATTGEKIRLLLSRFFEPTAVDLEAVRLPAAMASLYYLIRPARLLWRACWPKRRPSPS
jgi:hypothetical protein